MASMTSLQDLFVNELRDMYDAEKQISKTLPKLAKATSSDELRSAFEEHQQQTLQHIERLEQAFEELDSPAKGTRCHGMAGIIEEGSALLDKGADGPVLDAGLIASAQKVEHYEIAAYGTLITFAKTLGHQEIAELLGESLNEEKETDGRLTELAENRTNLEAMSAGRARSAGGTT